MKASGREVGVRYCFASSTEAREDSRSEPVTIILMQPAETAREMTAGRSEVCACFPW